MERAENYEKMIKAMSFNLLQLAISSIQYKNLYLENRYKLRIATPDELFCEQEEESMIKIEEALLSDTQKKLDEAEDIVWSKTP